MRKVREQDIQTTIIEYLRLRKFLVFKHHSTASTIRGGEPVFFRNGDRGISDIIGCTPHGRFLAIEVKKPGGRVSDDQRGFLEQVRASGGIGFVAFSLDDVIETLESTPLSVG